MFQRGAAWVPFLSCDHSSVILTELSFYIPRGPLAASETGLANISPVILPRVQMEDNFFYLSQLINIALLPGNTSLA